MGSEPPWKAIAERKQSERQSRIPKAWLLSSPPPSTLDVLSLPLTSGILTPLEINITSSHDATSLSSLIRSRKYTAVQVTTAFCKRAAIAQQVCNCLTEILFDEALQRAQYLDEYYERTGKPVGPLHGIPISLKDTFKIKGYDASIGIASLAFKPATENSLLVDILLEAGAVLYCKTNIPQTLMALDSDNNVFGRVMNPRNRLVTAGGSSGGEGALIAMRGSILGVGTDVGGSIRIPAMCNGVYGVKPGSMRVPYIGQEGPGGSRSDAVNVGLMASAGPIAGSIRDCEFLLKTISDARPWERDPSLAFGMWEAQGEMQRKPLLGVIRTDGLITPLPPIAKVLDETVGSLRNAGVEVIEVNAPAFKKCQSLANSFFGIDGANHMLDLLEATQEPLIPWLSTRLRRKPPMSLQKLVEIHAKKVQLETEMLKIWKDPKTGKTIDAIICPVAPHPVPPIDRWNGASYTSSFVLLDYPAGALPVRDFKEADLTGEMSAGEPLGSWDKVNRELCEWLANECMRDLLIEIGDEKTIDRKVYLNTKLSIQVVAPKMQERRLVQAMSLIDEILQHGGPQRVKL